MQCKKDFGVRVGIDNELVQQVQPELDTLPYDSDAILRAEIACRDCNKPGEKDVRLFCGVTESTYRIGDTYAAGARYAGVRGWIRGQAICSDEQCGTYFAVKIFFGGETMMRVEIDPHQSDIAEGLL
jgi:hypothetical protein